jgi:hypothetical protein
MRIAAREGLKLIVLTNSANISDVIVRMTFLNQTVFSTKLRRAASDLFSQLFTCGTATACDIFTRSIFQADLITEGMVFFA